MNGSRDLPRPSLVEHLRLAVGINDLAATLERVHRTFGPVVDVGYRIPLRAVYLFGPQANQHVLADNAANFTWREAFRLLEVVDGPTALVMSDGAAHRRRRRLVQPAFALKRIDAHLDLIVSEFDQTLDGWRPGRHLNAHAELRSAVRRIVVRALFGRRLGGLADEIGERLEPALRYVQRTPLSRLDVDLRWNGYARARQAARAVDALILTEVARRRAEGVDAVAHPDALSALLAAADEVEGPEAGRLTDAEPEAEPAGEAVARAARSPQASKSGPARHHWPFPAPPGDENSRAGRLTDAELCDQIRSLIAAGYDTTSSSAAWLVQTLGSHPKVLAALREQVRDTIGDRAPTVDDLRAMPLVDGVVRETLRLWPPAAIGGRRAVDDFEVLGHRISGGSMVLYSPYITHRMPELWGDPETFRPQRWADGEPVPYSFVPFGGGPRKCVGFALATLELQVLAVRLAQRVSWRLDDPHSRPTGIASFAPRGGVPVTII